MTPCASCQDPHIPLLRDHTVSSSAESNSSTAEPDFFSAQVVARENIATGIWRFTLRRADGTPMGAFSAGSHLTVALPAGMRRNYSLCSDPADTSTWQIAVKRDSAGRGGSVSMVDDVQAGDLIQISAPRNNFALEPRATQFLFIAGGIGITPILSMMLQLARQPGCRFRLIYCTRDEAGTAFREELRQGPLADHVQMHHDQGDLAQAIDLWPVFETPGPEHVYCCGPRGLMESVADMSGHWPSGSIHFESFGVDASVQVNDTAFSVVLQRSGKQITVAANQSLLEALRASGQPITSSCESGTCGSCRTRLLSGESEHRDMVLQDDEKEHNIMVCVSRARSPELVLDL